MLICPYKSGGIFLSFVWAFLVDYYKFIMTVPHNNKYFVEFK